jgi:hypothetical protein
MVARFKRGCLSLVTVLIVPEVCVGGRAVTRPIGGGGGRLGRVSSGGVRSRVVSGDGGCRSDGTTRSRGVAVEP